MNHVKDELRMKGKVLPWYLLPRREKRSFFLETENVPKKANFLNQRDKYDILDYLISTLEGS